MRNRSLLRLLAALGALAIIGLSGCGNKPEAQNSAPSGGDQAASSDSGSDASPDSGSDSSSGGALTVKVGIIQPLTGSVSLDGTSFVNGAKLAAEKMNAEGGVKLELVVEDGQCKPDVSASAAEKLINDDKVSVLVGAFCSTATAGVIPTSEQNQIPLVTGVSSAPNLTEERHEWFFRLAPTEAMLAAAASPYLVNELGITNVAFLAVNDDWGRGSVKSQTALFEANNIKVAATEYFNHGETNFTPYLTKIQSINPGAVFFVAETQDASLAIQQYHQMGLTYPKLGVGAMAGKQFIDLVGEAADGMIAIVPYAYTFDKPENHDFVAAYEKAYNAKPDKYSMAGHNAIEVVFQAVRQANSADPKAIQQALDQGEFNTLVGPVKFNDKHQAFLPAMIARIEKGEPKVLAVVETK